jgi:hypothetical protein
MITFLDILYLVCCNFYKRREKDDFKISGLILLSAVFEFNIIMITLIIPRFYPDLFAQSFVYQKRYHIIGICLIVFATLLYLRYFKITNYDEVYQNIQCMKDLNRSVYSLLAVVYVIASFLVTIVLGVMIGSSSNAG